MKLFRLTCLFICMAGFAFFTSCSDNGPDGPDDSGDPIPDNISKEYFTINGDAEFVAEKNLPTSTKGYEIDINAEISKIIVNNGSAILNFNTNKKVDTIFIGIDGVEGYYKMALPDVGFDQGKYSYDVTFLINTDISKSDFVIEFALQNKEGEVSAVKQTNKLTVKEANTGELQVTLTWDNTDDLDLHILDPDSLHIWSANGTLFNDEVDANEFKFYFQKFLLNKYHSNDYSSLDYSKPADRLTIITAINDLFTNYLEEEDYDEFKEQAEFLNSIDGGDYKQHIIGSMDIKSNGTTNPIENIYFSPVKTGDYVISINLTKKDSDTPAAKYSVTLNHKGESKFDFSDKLVGQLNGIIANPTSDTSKFVKIGTYKVR